MCRNNIFKIKLYYYFRDISHIWVSSRAWHVTLVNPVLCRLASPEIYMPCTYFRLCISFKYIIFEIITSSFLRPALEIGFSDKTLKVQSMDLDSSTHAGGIVYGTLTVVGHELGLKRICLDSVSNPRYVL